MTTIEMPNETHTEGKYLIRRFTPPVGEPGIIIEWREGDEQYAVARQGNRYWMYSSVLIGGAVRHEEFVEQSASEIGQNILQALTDAVGS